MVHFYMVLVSVPWAMAKKGGALRKEDPNCVESELFPHPPIHAEQSDDHNTGTLHIVLEFDENGTARQVQNPYTVYGSSGHCALCGHSSYNCLNNNEGSFDVTWGSISFGGVTLGPVTSWSVTARGPSAITEMRFSQWRCQALPPQEPVIRDMVANAA